MSQIPSLTSYSHLECEYIYLGSPESGPDLIIYDEGHHVGQELEHEGYLQPRLPEVLGLDHLPGAETEGEHAQKEQERGLVPWQHLLLHIVDQQYRLVSHRLG